MSSISRALAAHFYRAAADDRPTGIGRSCALIGATALVLFRGPAGLTVLCLVVAAGCGWWGRRSADDPVAEPVGDRRPEGEAQGGQDPEGGDRPVTAAQSSDVPEHLDVDRLSDRALCQAWRASYLRLQRLQDVPDPSGVARVTRERSQLLDELQRRDPTGFDAWLVAGARAPSDPGRYLGAVPRQRRTARE